MPCNLGRGVTVGVLPFEKLQMEVGVDYIRYGAAAYDDNPVYFNAKLGTPEGSLFKYSPAIAVGITTSAQGRRHCAQHTAGYSVLCNGGKDAPHNRQIIRRRVCRQRRQHQLQGPPRRDDNSGVLLSWDRVMTEISDKLWLGVDYQGGNNAYGALNFGASWAFSEKRIGHSGYDIYTRKATGGQPTLHRYR